MSIVVAPYSAAWPTAFAEVAHNLRRVLADLPGAAVEHVGSTAVPGLAAKPILDIDVIVEHGDVDAAIEALEKLGYSHRGNLGLEGREAFIAPDDTPARNVYVCARGTLHVRNHLAVRDVLRRRNDLRDEYAAVKLALAADPRIDIARYLAGKSAVLQKILAEADLTDLERQQIWLLNQPAAPR